MCVVCVSNQIFIWGQRDVKRVHEACSHGPLKYVSPTLLRWCIKAYFELLQKFSLILKIYYMLCLLFERKCWCVGQETFNAYFLWILHAQTRIQYIFIIINWIITLAHGMGDWLHHWDYVSRMQEHSNSILGMVISICAISIKIRSKHSIFVCGRPSNVVCVDEWRPNY